jgi:hypothetical protein
MPWQRQSAPDPDSGGPDPSRSPDAGARLVTPDLLAWANVVDATRLSDKTVKAAERFLRDYRRMTSLIARREIALRLRANIETQVSPPPPPTVGSMDVIATVLSLRRKQLGLPDG